MAESATTLEDIERLIAERRRSGAFPPAVEACFERETGARRARFLADVTLNAVVVYNCFLLGDYLLAPDMLQLSAVLHLAIVTPFMLVVARLLPSVVSPVWRETLAGSISLAMIAQILAVYCLTTSSYAAHYFYFVPAVMLCIGSLQRLDFRHALRLSLAIMAMIACALIVRGEMPTEIAAAHALTFATCIGVMLNSNLIVVREQRRLYLHSLRDRLRADRSDSHANLDALTGLGNRRYLENRARSLWSGGSSRVAAVIFDADFFKSFNDRYGHSAGDMCLKRVAACALTELRETADIAVRLGGEEFLLLLADTDVEIGEMVAERVRATVAALAIPHEDNPRRVVTASFGVASCDTRYASLEALCAAADSALYAAKNAGRNCTRSAPALAQPQAA